MIVWCEDHKRSDCSHALSELGDALAAENEHKTERAMKAEAEVARLSEVLRRIAADWHRVECPEIELCDCHERTARAALGSE